MEYKNEKSTGTWGFGVFLTGMEQLSQWLCFSFPSLKYSLPRGLWNMKRDLFSIVSLGEDTHIKYVLENCFVHIPCIRLLYLSIKNFGYMPIVLSLKKCCGHNKEFHKK